MHGLVKSRVICAWVGLMLDILVYKNIVACFNQLIGKFFLSKWLDCISLYISCLVVFV